MGTQNVPGLQTTKSDNVIKNRGRLHKRGGEEDKLPGKESRITMVRLEDYPEFNGYITGLDEYGERYIPSGLTLRRRENERKALGLSKADYEDLVRQAEQEEEEVCQIIRDTLVRNGFVK